MDFSSLLQEVFDKNMIFSVVSATKIWLQNLTNSLMLLYWPRIEYLNAYNHLKLLMIKIHYFQLYSNVTWRIRF